MRIIAGKYRRRKLHAPVGTTTRPITDRVKEQLFENLGDRLEGKRVADVFSGTGSLGLEALSRGARSVVFFEKDHRSHELLRQNVAMLEVEADTLCWRVDILRSSFRPKGRDDLLPYDFLFFDPPYRMVEQICPGTPIFRCLERMAREDVSSSEAVLILRTAARADFTCPDVWVPWGDTLRISSMDLHLMRKAPADE